jgi:hypothetical protein
LKLPSWGSTQTACFTVASRWKAAVCVVWTSQIFRIDLRKVTRQVTSVLTVKGTDCLSVWGEIMLDILETLDACTLFGLLF